MINTHFTNIPHHKYRHQIQNRTVYTQKQPIQDSISFKGHFGEEEYNKDDIKCLKHETGFFRDIETKEFVKDYIEKNFAEKEKINIIVGGCSTGEEAYTYAMLLDKLKNKTKIIGFDLSEKSINDAKSKKFLMQKQVKAPDGMIDAYTYLGHTLDDTYLCFQTDRELTPQEIERKNLFDKFFEISKETPAPEKMSLRKRINLYIIKNFLKMFPPTFENKYVVAKENKFNNCEFVQGDILNLKDITKNEKADVITFSNALYHITTEEIGQSGIRKPKYNYKKVVEELISQLKENLAPNGLFVVGEDEIMQMFDSGEFNNLMKDNGFEPLNKTNEHLENVWKLK